jgi:predicted dinucleotide-utilizing enzyme
MSCFMLACERIIAIARARCQRQGRYLTEKLLAERERGAALEIAFVWNRTASKVRECTLLAESQILIELDEFERFGADLIVEVAHPAISAQYISR